FRLAFAGPPRHSRFGQSHTEQLAGSFFNRHAIRPRPGVATRTLCPLTAHRRTVSGSISLPARWFFSPFPHGTVHYRSPRLFSLGTWASPLPTGFLVPGGTHAPFPRSAPFAYRALTVSGGPSQGPSAKGILCHSARERSLPPKGRPTPPCHRPTDHSGTRVWARPGSLAATTGISVDFCAGGTEMFPFPPLPSHVTVGSRDHSRGVSP